MNDTHYTAQINLDYLIIPFTRSFCEKMTTTAVLIIIVQFGSLHTSCLFFSAVFFSISSFYDLRLSFSLSLSSCPIIVSRNSDPGSYTSSRLPPPYPLLLYDEVYGSRLAFSREDFSSFSSLVDSRRIVLAHAGRSAI